MTNSIKQIDLPLDNDLNLSVDAFRRILMSGNGGTLTTDVAIGLTGSAYEGQEIELWFDSQEVNVDGNTLTIFGVDISKVANRSVMVKAVYFNSAWRVVVTDLSNFDPDTVLSETPVETLPGNKLVLNSVPGGALQDSGVSTNKIADDAITPAKAADATTKDTFVFDIDTTGALKDVRRSYWVDYDFSVTQVAYEVIENIVTDDLTLQVIAGAGTILDTTVVASGTGAGIRSNTPPDSLAEVRGIVNPGAWLALAPSKTTSGGRVTVTVTLKKI